jgi:uncharacterized protein (TIGR03067 family)
MKILATIALIASAVAGTVARADDTKDLQGEWQAVEAQINGKKVTKDDDDAKNMRLIIKDNDLTIPSPKGDGKDRKKTFKLDASKSPKQIDITSLDGAEKDQTAACIYKLEKDRLTLCIPYFAKDPTVRPTEFKAGADDGIMLMTLERVKQK